MGSQIINGLLGCVPENTTAWFGEAVPVVTQVASAAIGALSEFSYLQIGGAGLLAAGAGYLSYRYFDERDVRSRAIPLILDDMSEVEKASILHAIRQIPSGEREGVIRLALLLIEGDMSVSEKVRILYGIQEIPSGEREDVVWQALPLMRANMREWTKLHILRAIQKIPSEERNDVIQKVLIFLRNDVSEMEIDSLLSTIRKIPHEEWKDFMDCALLLLNDDMIEFERTSLLRNIQEIPSEEREDVIDRALPLIGSEMSGAGIGRLLHTIQEISSEQREDVIDRALPLMRHDMDGFEKSKILRAVENILSEEWEDVIDRASLLMRDDMEGEQKVFILNAIRDIPSEEREDVIDRALPLMRDDREGEHKAIILNLTRNIPSEERKDVIDLAASLIRDDMAWWMKTLILRAVRRLPLAERNPRTARALEQIQIDFPGGEIDDFYIYLNRITQLLETPLDQAFLPMGQDNAMAAAAAAGHAEINVHAGNRDARVKAALLLLRKSQSMTEQEINSATNECIQYLKEGGQSRALWVLKGPNSPNDFGPFFKEIIINGESTSGREVIGRLWGFIEALPELEKQLALDSLVTGLNHCVNENGERICNPGKMQHLFIAVLQGRLPEVEVDDSIKIPKIEQAESSSSASSQEVPVQDAMRLFFENPKHREIVEFEELLEAAKAFCLENPLVNREEFIKEMKSYAERQGIDSKGKEEE